MAEWSKALRSGRSPLLWAGVRISLLTNPLFLKICSDCQGISVSLQRISITPTPHMKSRVAQWKRAGPITQRSVDRNYALLSTTFFLFYYATVGQHSVRKVQFSINCVPLAQRIARWTSNPKVLGSIPRWDDSKLFWIFGQLTFTQLRLTSATCQNGRVV